MLSYQTYDISTVLLILFLCLSVIGDIKKHRIPNWLTYGMFSIGLILQYIFLQGDGLLTGLQGSGVGLAVLVIFYFTGGMGAGDVKLMAAVGSFIGPWAVFQAACFSLVIGGCVALFLILRSGEFFSIYRRYAAMIAVRTFLPAEPGSVVRHRFPFSSAIAVGTLIQQGITGKLDFYHLSTQLTYQLQALGVMQ